jgi:hypothetical protein
VGFFDRLRQTLGGSQKAGAGAYAYRIYAQCSRCGEPLRARIDLVNDPSQEDDGTYIVRKALLGGTRRCYQTVDVTLHFNTDRSQVLDREIGGGRFITAEEYQTLVEEQQEPLQEQEDDA